MTVKMTKIKNYYLLPWTYPKNWIDNIKNFFRGIKRFIQRGRYGVCLYDIWDLDTYMLKVFENGIKIFQEKEAGYPALLKEEEEWKDILSHMEKLLIIVQTEGTECEKAEQYWEKDNELWIGAVKEWEDYRKKCWYELCDLMKDWYFHLWM